MRLNDLPDKVGSEPEVFEKAFDGFGKNAEITVDERERILSSVMRKAGFETMNVKRHKRSVIIGVIAAAALMGTVCAAAYGAGYRLEDGQIVRLFYGGQAGEYLTENYLTQKKTVKTGIFPVQCIRWFRTVILCVLFSVWRHWTMRRGNNLKSVLTELHILKHRICI